MSKKSIKNVWPKGRNAEYLSIVEKVDADGACYAGVLHMLQYDDFYTMFMDIPDPSWVFWLMEHTSTEDSAFPVEAKRNAIMVFLNDAEKLFKNTAVVRYAKSIPWDVKDPWSTLYLNDAFSRASTPLRYALADAVRCDPENMFTNIIDLAGMPQCWLKHWHEFLRNIDIDHIEAAWTRKRRGIHGVRRKFTIREDGKILPPLRGGFDE